jgi:hypothetical protein
MTKKATKWTGDYFIRTDGKNWQVRKQKTVRASGSLEAHVKKMQDVLEQHPKAEISLEDDEDNPVVLIEWWSCVRASHPDVVEYLAEQQREADLEREYEEKHTKAIEKFKRTRTGLFATKKIK